MRAHLIFYVNDQRRVRCSMRACWTFNRGWTFPE